MGKIVSALVCGAGFLGLSTQPCLAQAPAAYPVPVPALPAPLAPLAVEQPAYTTLVLELDVKRPARQVWARIGKFCDLGEWMGMPCKITQGDDFKLGSVRVLGNGIVEMLVSKTELSYTYAQPVRVGVPYNAYHGSLEVRPTGRKTSRLVYSFFYDTSMLADDAARARESAARKARFNAAMANMKLLAEGGQLPPAR